MSCAFATMIYRFMCAETRIIYTHTCTYTSVCMFYVYYMSGHRRVKESFPHIHVCVYICHNIFTGVSQWMLTCLPCLDADIDARRLRGLAKVEAYCEMYEEITRRLAFLVAEWLRVGYVQGNMNSDNTALGGHTIDFGPFGIMEEYDPVSGTQSRPSKVVKRAISWRVGRLLLFLEGDSADLPEY